MGSVDVVLLTKNSEKVLEKCLESVYQNVPVNQLIVVDGYSTDGTLGILDGFNRKHRNVTVTFDKAVWVEVYFSLALMNTWLVASQSAQASPGTGISGAKLTVTQSVQVN